MTPCEITKQSDTPLPPSSAREGGVEAGPQQFVFLGDGKGDGNELGSIYARYLAAMGDATRVRKNCRRVIDVFTYEHKQVCLICRRLHRDRQELPQRASTAERPRQSRLLGLGHISNPFGMLGNSLVSSSELLFKLIDDSHPQIIAGIHVIHEIREKVMTFFYFGK